MSIRYPNVPDEVARPIVPVGVARPLPPLFPIVFANSPSKAITPGARVYPFAGLQVIAPERVTSARRRKDGGAFINISIGVFTDILQAARFYSEIVNIYGTFLHEIELTDAKTNVGIASLHVVSAITAGGGGKVVTRNRAVRPFSDATIAEDSTQINIADYEVSGDQTIARTAIPRTLIVSGTHIGANNVAILSNTGYDFTKLGIRLNKDILKNTTDGSSGTITAVTATTITATLVGGTENDWDTSDVFNVVDGDTLVEVVKRFQFSPSVQGLIKVTLFVKDLSANESSASVIIRVT